MRSHEPLPHTADIGFRAVAADLRDLFEEAAFALAEVSADSTPGVPASIRRSVELTADDLPGLAFSWLSELISLADVHDAAIVEATVTRLESRSRGNGPGPWRLSGRLGLRAYRDGGIRPRLQVKSATYHGLVVERTGEAWEMRAFMDV